MGHSPQNLCLVSFIPALTTRSKHRVGSQPHWHGASAHQGETCLQTGSSSLVEKGVSPGSLQDFKKKKKRRRNSARTPS